MSKLRQFGADKVMVEELSASVDLYLDREIIKRVKQGLPVVGYKEAGDIFHSWLRALLDELTPPQRPNDNPYSDAE